MGIRIVPKNAQYSVFTKAIHIIAQLYRTGCRWNKSKSRCIFRNFSLLLFIFTVWVFW